MRIVDHRLVPDPHDTIEINHREVAGWRAGMTPEIIVIHYAVTHSLEATVAAQAARSYWAHLSIDGYSTDGRSTMRVTQALPFNKRGAHCGESRWRGRGACNGFAIGIEIANPGPLVKGEDGLLRTTYKKLWPASDAIETGPIKGYPKAWTHWAKYSEEEIGICGAVCLALKAQYPTIVDIVGHSDIAPGRKFDPGPAFPLPWLKSLVFPTPL